MNTQCAAVTAFVLGMTFSWGCVSAFLVVEFEPNAIPLRIINARSEAVEVEIVALDAVGDPAIVPLAECEGPCLDVPQPFRIEAGAQRDVYSDLQIALDHAIARVPGSEVAQSVDLRLSRVGTLTDETPAAMPSDFPKSRLPSRRVPGLVWWLTLLVPLSLLGEAYILYVTQRSTTERGTEMS